MSDIDYYICEGTEGRTFGLVHDGRTYLKTENPKGEMGRWRVLEEIDHFNKWPLERWIGEMGSEEVSYEEFLSEYQP